MIKSSNAQSLGDYIAGANQWLLNAAWPLWLEHGVDWKRQAFHENLDHNTLKCTADFRRLRVAARQTYVFAQAASAHVAGAEKAVAMGIAFLLGPARLDDGSYAWRFDLDNKVIDDTRDLYDHAFVLLAFATAAPLYEKSLLHGEALKLLDFIDLRFPHKEGGYEEAIPAQLPRRQNPHMHLLEALLAAFETFKDIRFFDRAKALIELFAQRFFEKTRGALPEFFDDRLVPILENGRFCIEPGHHYEWVWLLERYRALAPMLEAGESSNLSTLRDALAAFADKHGLDASTGLVKDLLWSDGESGSNEFRLWPQMERLKREMRRPDGETDKKIAGFHAAAKHFEGAKPGLWHERLDPQGRPLSYPAPATSLYHICCAVADVTALHRDEAKAVSA